MAFGHGALCEWPLDPGVTYLNHGTVGVTPLRVLEAQRRIRDAAERAPSQFLFRQQSGMLGPRSRRPTLVREAAAAVAAFVGAEPEDLVFVDNATTAVNAVLRSITFAPGDQVLLTDHTYGAIAKAVNVIAVSQGAVVKTVPVPYPEFNPAALLDRIDHALTSRTRLAIVDHITAESGLVFPLAAIARACRARGVRVLADGAHAPGVLPLDIASLGVDWYAANLHKWACVPRSCGFLWASGAAQADLKPPVISWGADDGFAPAFDWVGTRDVSAWLAVPEALAYLRERGLDAAWDYNHELAWKGATTLAEAWGTSIPAGKSDVGFMVTVPVPRSLGSQSSDAVELRDALLFDHQIEVQVHAGYGRLWVRISAQVYNELSDVERLADAVLSIARGR